MDLDDYSDRLLVERRHDGVSCRNAKSALGLSKLGLLLPMLAVPVLTYMAYAGSVHTAVPLSVSALAVLVGGALWRQRAVGSSVEVTSRWVTVANSGFGGRFHAKLALQDIQRVLVARHKGENAGFYLVFDDGDEQYICFSGLPERDLAYIRDLVAEARDARERRQEREGKEYRFQQAPPQSISEIVER